MVVVEGPDGAPAETTHPDGCERAPLVETTPNPALQPLWRGHGKVRHPSRLWRRWARANLRGGGSVTEPHSSSASEATSDMLSSASSSSLPPNETRSLTLAEGTLVRLDKKDGRNLSVWRKRGTRDLSRRELAENQANGTGTAAMLGRVEGGSADRGRWVLLRGVSTASRLLWISVDEVVVAEGEKI